MIEAIKAFLIKEYDCISWQEFIDNQVMGDCQSIVADIVREFTSAKKKFGNIEVDIPAVYNEDDEVVENYYFTHHWVEIDDHIFDFSKGTLKDSIEWADLYGVEQDGDKWRYRFISCV